MRMHDNHLLHVFEFLSFSYSVFFTCTGLLNWLWFPRWTIRVFASNSDGCSSISYIYGRASDRLVPEFKHCFTAAGRRQWFSSFVQKKSWKGELTLHYPSQKCKRLLRKSAMMCLLKIVCVLCCNSWVILKSNWVSPHSSIWSPSMSRTNKIARKQLCYRRKKWYAILRVLWSASFPTLPG